MAIGRSEQARAKILARIRAASGQGERMTDAPRLQALQAYLDAHARGPMPEVSGDLVARFREKAESLQSTTEVVQSESEVPAALARYLEAFALPRSGCVWPALAHLDWGGAGLALEPRGARGEDLVGVTGAFAALAETGTIMVVSGPDTPATVSLLPETHIAVLPASRIVAHMEDAFQLAREAFGKLPRAVNFISGPSRTGDIEQQLVLGAHGPYRVHVIVVRS